MLSFKLYQWTTIKLPNGNILDNEELTEMNILHFHVITFVAVFLLIILDIMTSPRRILKNFAGTKSKESLNGIKLQILCINELTFLTSALC